MAGYILKITIENSHPPVWRRVVVPENITFRDLSEIIQILFGWDGYHLHEFEYPKEYFRVVCPEDDMGWGSMHLEEETPIDPYIKTFPWIRYTYDFGDDWRHKIVLEKVKEDFSERHAVLLKLKGENFEEDCGGIFGIGEGGRIPVDEIEVNARLAGYDFPVFQAKKSNTAKDDKRMEDDTEDILFSLFKNVFSDAIAGCSESEKEEVYRAICESAYNDICANVKMPKQHPSKASRRLDDWCDDTDNILGSGGHITLKFQKSPDDMASMLADWHRTNIEDYCKYLGIPFRKSATKKSMAAAVSDMFTAHPEYVQMLFMEEELDILKNYLDAAEKNVSCDYDDDTDNRVVVKAVHMGLFRIETLGEQRLIHVASDAAALIKAVYAGDWKKYYERVAEIEHACSVTLMMYGMVDIDFLHACCERIVGASLEKDEFFRMVYWHGRMNEIYLTAKREDTGEKIVMLPELELSTVRAVAQCCGGRPEYRIFSDEELDAWKKGFFEAIPEWLDYEDLLYMVSEPEQEEMFLWLAGDYEDLMGGTSATEFLQELYDTFSEELTPDLAVGLWESVMCLAVKTPLAGLGGHSRESYAALTGKPLDAVFLFDEDRLDRRVTKETMLHQFPADMQLELYEASASPKKEVYINCLNRYLKKYRNNEALLAALALAESERILVENPGVAEDLMMYEQFRQNADGALYPWDEETLGAIKPLIEPFVRSQPKVGRNDPCPCGSGKKYKKCCGR